MSAASPIISNNQPLLPKAGVEVWKPSRRPSVLDTLSPQPSLSGDVFTRLFHPSPQQLTQFPQESVSSRVMAIAQQWGQIAPSLEALFKAHPAGDTTLEKSFELTHEMLTRPTSNSSFAQGYRHLDTLIRSLTKLITSGFIPSEAALPYLEKLKTLQHDLATVVQLHALPFLQSDGMIRTRLHTIEPLDLLFQQLDPVRSTNPSAPLRPFKVDVAIVGGGPSGLSTALNAVNQDFTATVLEGGYIGQSFSDGLAQHVHVLRTQAAYSSLIRHQNVVYDPSYPARIIRSYSLATPQGIGSYRKPAIEARQEITQHTGQRFNPCPPEHDQMGNPLLPIARAELFQYMVRVADDVDANPNGIVIEQAPVRGIHYIAPHQKEAMAKTLLEQYTQLLKSSELSYAQQKPLIAALEDSIAEALEGPKGVFLLETSPGHLQLADNVVVAAGMVGSSGEHGRSLPAFEDLANQSNHYVQIRHHGDAVASAASFANLLHPSSESSEPSPQLMINDAMLGHPDVKRAVRQLPEGARSVVIGSGESAVKSVCELLNLNPNTTVDLYTNQKLKGNQLQIPETHAVQARYGLLNHALGRQFLRQFKDDYGVPITPDTINQLLEYEQAGKLRVIYMPQGATRHSIIFKRTETQGENKKQQTDLYRVHNRFFKWLFQGVYWALGGPFKSIRNKLFKPTSQIDGVMVSAVGYDRKRKSQSPLAQQLVNQGLAKTKEGPWWNRKRIGTEFLPSSKNGLSSALNDHLFFNGPFNLATSTDTTIPGSALRSFEIIRYLKELRSKRQWYRFHSDPRLLADYRWEGVLMRLAKTSSDPKELYEELSKTLRPYQEEGESNDHFRQRMIWGTATLKEDGSLSSAWLSNHQSPRTLEELEQGLVKHITRPMSMSTITTTASSLKEGVFYGALAVPASQSDEDDAANSSHSPKTFLFVASRFFPKKYSK